MLTARRAVLSDAEWLLNLRNDPATVSASISQRSVLVAEHAVWFANALTDTSCALMVVEAPELSSLDQRVATYRLNRIGSDQVEISLIVALEYQGRGEALHVIGLAARHAMREGPESVTALVKRENTRSLRAFLHAGFWVSPPSTDDSDLLLLAIRPEDIAARLCDGCRDSVPHHTNSPTSIGRDDGRWLIYDLHAREEGYGFVTYECDAGDLWLAWDDARRARRGLGAPDYSARTTVALDYDGRIAGEPTTGVCGLRSGERAGMVTASTDKSAIVPGSSPGLSTTHQPCADADCILCPGWGERGGDD